MRCSKPAALQRPYLGLKGQPTWIKRASAPCPASLLVSHFQRETYLLLLTLMNLMVSWHAKVHSHLLCWQPAHIEGGVPCSGAGVGGGMDSNQ